MRSLIRQRCLVLAVGLLGILTPVQAQWMYEIERANPLQGTASTYVNHSVIGRFSDGTTLLGASKLQQPVVVDGASMYWDSWIFDSETRTASLVGLRDAEHSAPDGSSLSFFGATNGFWFSYSTDIGEVAFGHSVRFAGTTPNGYSAWGFVPRSGTPAGGQTHRFGFVDSDHTRQSDGRRDSRITLVSGPHCAGVSERYGPPGSPTASGGGHDGWCSRGIDGTTVLVGLHDSQHVQSGTGQRECQPKFIAPTGRVFGTSTLYHTATMAPGASVWTFDPVTEITTRIGLLDAAHTDQASGYHRSAVSSTNSRGDAIGSTERFETGRDLGQSSWLYLASTGECLRVGLVDPAHTSATGVQSTWLNSVDDNGIVRGVSSRWQAGTVAAIEQTPFVYDSVTRTYHILPGLEDAEHTGPVGEHRSFAQVVVGRHVLGSSYRWVGSTFGGYSLWDYDLETRETRHIAPDGPDFADPTVPYRASEWLVFSSSPTRRFVLAKTGFARIPSQVPDGPPPSGNRAWIYDVETGIARRLGYADSAHTSPSGSMNSSVDDHVLANRYVVGTSERFDPPGTSTWLYDTLATATVPILGVSDANHTGPNGSSRSPVSAYLPGHWIAGTSERYDASGSTVGYTMWVVDLPTLTTTVFPPDEPIPSYFAPLSPVPSPQGRLLASYRDASLAPVPPARIWSPAFGTRPLRAIVHPSSRELLLEPLFGAPSSLSDDPEAALWSRQSDGLLPNVARAVFAWIPGAVCPSDLDDGSTLAIPDGGTTVEDLLYFLDRFDAGSLAADMDDGSGTGAHDDAVTVDDLLFFLSHFEAGC